VIADLGDGAFLIRIDRNFLHEVSGAVSLKEMDKRGRHLRNPELAFGTLRCRASLQLTSYRSNM
jgi:3-isopropylmalate/(R)-2-methylmalate dehydratase large subunit